MFKTLFCQVFLLFFFCCNLLGQTDGTFGSDNENIPLVHEYVINSVDRCLVPSDICNESSTISTPASNVTHIIPLTATNAITGLEFLPFGIMLDVGDFETVPLFLSMTPRILDDQTWLIEIGYSQFDWTLEITGGSSMTLNISAPGTSNQLALIDFAGVLVDGQYSIHMSVNLFGSSVFDRTLFRTYDYCENYTMIDCSEYSFVEESITTRNITHSWSAEDYGNVETGERDGGSSPSILNSPNNTERSTTTSLDGWKVANPFHDVINVYLPQVISQAGELTLYSLDGRQVQQFHIPDGGSYYQLPTDGLPNGTYLLRMIVGDEIQSKMIIKS